MHPREGARVGSRREISGCHGFVVLPQRDLEAVTLIDAWLHPRLESRYRTAGIDEPLRELDLELRGLMRDRRHAARTLQGISRKVSLLEL